MKRLVTAGKKAGGAVGRGHHLEESTHPHRLASLPLSHRAFELPHKFASKDSYESASRLSCELILTWKIVKKKLQTHAGNVISQSDIADERFDRNDTKVSVSEEMRCPIFAPYL